MIIKSFTAETASAAMKLVRKDMGGDAIVLKTKQVTDRRNRRQVEITACIEAPTVAQASSLLVATGVAPVETTVNRLPRDITEPMPELPTEPEPIVPEPQPIPKPTIELVAPAPAVMPVNDERFDALEAKLDRLADLMRRYAPADEAEQRLEPVREVLRKADLSEEFINEFTDRYAAELKADNPLDNARLCLVTELAHLMVPDLKIKPGDRLLFVGPAGAGKSSVMGKLATQLVTRDKRKVALAGLEFHKVGAYEELTGYADLLNVDVASASEPASGRKVITLIDAPAMPSDPNAREAFVNSARAARASHCFVVVSALTRSTDMLAFAQQLKAVGPTHIIGTMLDLTDRYGSLVTAAKALDAKIALISDRKGAAGRVKAPDPAALAAAITGTEVVCE